MPKKKKKPFQPKINWRWEPTMKTLRIGFILCVFIILICTILIFVGLEVLLENVLLFKNVLSSRALVVLICAAASIAIGGFITYVVLLFPMRPIKVLIRGMTSLANGHFEERLHFGQLAPLKEMSDAFNALASELQNTELLRTDFVNNFSHEFKTPIVSIRGFARMLQRPDVTDAERQEYAGVIVDESTRLSNMANQVLALTKIENQHILTQQKSFNLSEQLRRCLLLLQKDWDEKQLDVQADFGEHLIYGDEALLQQVWVNLLDNAIKFSPQGASLEIRMTTGQKHLSVSIHNHGPQIPLEQQHRLYDKFWQGDSSRASQGTGIGLSIVKKVVDLHNGSIDVRSTEEETVFTVSLPTMH